MYHFIVEVAVCSTVELCFQLCCHYCKILSNRWSMTEVWSSCTSAESFFLQKFENVCLSCKARDRDSLPPPRGGVIGSLICRNKHSNFSELICTKVACSDFACAQRESSPYWWGQTSLASAALTNGKEVPFQTRLPAVYSWTNRLAIWTVSLANAEDHTKHKSTNSLACVLYPQ